MEKCLTIGKTHYRSISSLMYFIYLVLRRFFISSVSYRTNRWRRKSRRRLRGRESCYSVWSFRLKSKYSLLFFLLLNLEHRKWLLTQKPPESDRKRSLRRCKNSLSKTRNSWKNLNNTNRYKTLTTRSRWSLVCFHLWTSLIRTQTISTSTEITSGSAVQREESTCGSERITGHVIWICSS